VRSTTFGRSGEPRARSCAFGWLDVPDVYTTRVSLVLAPRLETTSRGPRMSRLGGKDR
jgi:hypothetical protein